MPRRGPPAGPFTPTNELMGGAVVNAIAAATGVRLYQTPFTAERVRAAMLKRPDESI